MTQRDSLQLLRKDHTMLASSVTALVEELGGLRDLLNEMKIEAAVRDERQKQIAESLAAIRSIAKWTLTSFLGAFVVAFVGFVVGGGLQVH